MPWKLGDKIIKEGTGWADNDGIRHPTNWNIWTDNEKKGAVYVTYFVKDNKYAKFIIGEGKKLSVLGQKI